MVWRDVVLRLGIGRIGELGAQAVRVIDMVGKGGDRRKGAGVSGLPSAPV